ncbi:MAG: hypothetical protein WD875_03140 [Pirellulales bacterium]
MAEDTPQNPPSQCSPLSSTDDPTQAPGEQPPSRETLKSAYNVFKKRWKLTRLDQESQIGRGPMSSGQRSAITGISPPDQYPIEIWNELVKQGRLKYAGNGCYALP